jgi:2-dehydro-3-deoxy-D-arabinonate dehydratase
MEEFLRPTGDRSIPTAVDSISRARLESSPAGLCQAHDRGLRRVTELTLVINDAGSIAGYTIGNDMSSRDIEGENPLYLPQAKVYDGSCAVGPCVLLSSQPLNKNSIRLEILRGAKEVYSGSTSLAELKRDPQQLIEYLFRDHSFPRGVLLMTGTGIVPADDFTLQHGDVIRIRIDEIGVLENHVA